MKCKKAILFLSLRLDGEISKREEQMLQKHLTSCVYCQKEWTIMQKQEMMLKNLKFPQPTEMFFDNFVANIPIAINRKQKWTINLQKFHTYIAVAACIFIICYLEYSWIFVSTSSQKMFVSLYKQERSLWEQAFMGNQKAQQEILQRQNKTYNYVLEKNLFLQNEEFCLEALRKDTGKPYTIVSYIHNNGNHKDLSLTILCEINIQNSLPILFQSLEKTELKERSKQLLVKYEMIAAPYLLDKIQQTSEIPTEWWSVVSSFSFPYSFPILEKCSSSGRYKKQALLALGKINNPKAVELLISYWNNEELHAEIIIALKDLQPHSRRMLSYLLKQDNSTAIEIIGEITENKLVPDLLQLYLTSAYRQKIVSSLAKIADPRTTDFFVNLTAKNQYRKVAYYTLGQLGDQSSIAFLLKNIQKNTHKSDCLNALKNVKNTAIIKPLIEIAFQQGMTSNIMEILMGFPREETIPYFIHMLNDSRLRNSAQKALKELTKQDFGSNCYLWQNWFAKSKLN